MFAFCNWQFKVDGFQTGNTSSDSELADLKVQIKVSSATGSSFGIVSAKQKEFDFGGSQSDDGTTEFKEMSLLRFADLEPHLVIAQPNIESKDPMDISITV